MERALTGETIGGGYRVDGELSGGNMGMVYVGTQLSVDRRVAIKVIDQERALSQRNVDRFLHEARIISKLEHPHIVRLYDFGRDEDFELLFLVMEHINGPTLSDLLRTHRFSQQLVLELGIQICRALIESHAQSVVHRDLKPANILLGRMSDGSLQLKVVDFGVARALETLDKQLTAEGAICGTPRYMPPEQARHGAKIDGRADLYALGLILYEMLCGYPPFDAEDAIELIFKHIKEAPRPLSTFLAPDLLHEGLEALVHELLKKNPDDRPDSALTVLQRLEALRAVVPRGFEPIRLQGSATIHEELIMWMAPALQEARASLVYGNTSQIGSEEMEPLETEWDHSHTVRVDINQISKATPHAPQDATTQPTQRALMPSVPGAPAPAELLARSHFDDVATRVVPSERGARDLRPAQKPPAPAQPLQEDVDFLDTLDPDHVMTLIEEDVAPQLMDPLAGAAPPPAVVRSAAPAPRVKLPSRNRTLSDTVQSFFLKLSGKPGKVVTGVGENTAENMFLNASDEDLAQRDEEDAYLAATRTGADRLLLPVVLIVVCCLIGVLGFAIWRGAEGEAAEAAQGERVDGLQEASQHTSPSPERAHAPPARTEAAREEASPKKTPPLADKELDVAGGDVDEQDGGDDHIPARDDELSFEDPDAPLVEDESTEAGDDGADRATTQSDAERAIKPRRDPPRPKRTRSPSKSKRPASKEKKKNENLDWLENL